MPIIARNDIEEYDYLKDWEHGLSLCFSTSEIAELFYAHEYQIISDPNLLTLFRNRQSELDNPLLKARSGETLSQKEAMKAVKMAVNMPNN